MSHALCLSLESELGCKPLHVKTVVYGVARGGVVPALHISYHFGIPFRTIEVSSKVENLDGEIKVHRRLPDVTELHDVENVIIADDIVDTGVTMEYILKHLEHTKALNNLNFNIITAALVIERDCEFAVDHSSYVNEGSWVVFPYEEGGETVDNG